MIYKGEVMAYDFEKIDFEQWKDVKFPIYCLDFYKDRFRLIGGSVRDDELVGGFVSDGAGFDGYIGLNVNGEHYGISAEDGNLVKYGGLIDDINDYTIKNTPNGRKKFADGNDRKYSLEEDEKDYAFYETLGIDIKNSPTAKLRKAEKEKMFEWGNKYYVKNYAREFCSPLMYRGSPYNNQINIFFNPRSTVDDNPSIKIIEELYIAVCSAEWKNRDGLMNEVTGEYLLKAARAYAEYNKELKKDYYEQEKKKEKAKWRETETTENTDAAANEKKLRTIDQKLSALFNTKGTATDEKAQL
jgi:hypothetical protein